MSRTRPREAGSPKDTRAAQSGLAALSLSAIPLALIPPLTAARSRRNDTGTEHKNRQSNQTGRETEKEATP